MKEKEGLFDLLTVKGIKPIIQNVFSKAIIKDSLGKLSFHFWENNTISDTEYLTLINLKKSNSGVSIVSIGNKEQVKTIYFSDSTMNLICFSSKKFSTINFSNSAFISIGSTSFTKSTIERIIQLFPNYSKVISIHSHSISGRIKDCLIQCWLLKKECSFKINNSIIIAKSNGKEINFPVEGFSLTNFNNAFSIRLKRIRTYKPKNRKFEDYYSQNFQIYSLEKQSLK